MEQDKRVTQDVIYSRFTLEMKTVFVEAASVQSRRHEEE